MNKTALKFLIRQAIGEPYVGKRMKLRYLDRLLGSLKLKNVDSILEVGCSDGLFTMWAKQKYPQAQVTGLDIDRETIADLNEWAKLKRHKNLRFIQHDLLGLAESEKYDLVLALDILEHITDDDQAIANIYNSLKSGGHVVVHVPNSAYHTLDGQIHHVPDELAWKINEGHVRQGYAPEKLKQKLEHRGFTVLKCFTAHGPLSDLAHRIYSGLEKPAILRLAAVPVIDVCNILDMNTKRKFGNTVFAVAQK